jgi:hypothetical protein
MIRCQTRIYSNRALDGVRITSVKKSPEGWQDLSQQEKRRVIAFCAEAVEIIVRSRRILALSARSVMRRKPKSWRP